jgi:carboxypeptidase Q
LKRIVLILAIGLVTLSAGCQSIAPYDHEADIVVEQLQQDAMSSDLAWDMLASLTSEVGPRMAGTPADKLAVRWAIKKMKDLGFDRVWTEPVKFPRWVRTSESAEVFYTTPPEPLAADASEAEKRWRKRIRLKKPVGQTLAITALGGSPSTHGRLEAELVQFDTLAALEAASVEDVENKIVFISTRMRKSREGTGYGETNINRTLGPFVAATKGALALLIRSVGTDNDRLPHTGMMSGSEPGGRVPSAAVSNSDADNLMLMLTGSEPVVVRMNLDVGFTADKYTEDSEEYYSADKGAEATSFNVIGEFDGSSDLAEFVLLGAHLDSWDLGTGAVDDGAGVALVMAAAKMVADLPVRPNYGLRVVLYANEEQGIYGGKAYANLHELELGSHLIGAESDLGADRIYRFKTRVSPAAEPVIAQLTRHLEKLGIERDESSEAGGGADVGQMGKLGLPLVDLNQDASRYFDLHHTANDTLDKVDPENLRQNLAAWVTLVYLTANSTIPFGPVNPKSN